MSHQAFPQIPRTTLAGTRFLVGLILWCGACPGPALAQQSEIGYDTTPHPVDLIPPGTVIGSSAPPNWSHMILKSIPRATAGDLDRVSRSNLQIASLFSTTVLANVVTTSDGANGRRHVLQSLAGGVNTRVNGRDVVVSPDTYRQIGANLGLITSQVLKEFHRQQSGVPVIIRADTLAVMDTPIVIRTPNQNRAMVLRYAVVVAPDTGRLDTLAWLIETDDKGGHIRIVSPLQWLPPNTIIDCQLHVDINEYRFGIPSKNAYACVNIPQGQVQMNVPPNAERLAVKERFAPAEAAALDAWLRSVIRHAEAALRNQQPQVR